MAQSLGGIIGQVIGGGLGTGLGIILYKTIGASFSLGALLLKQSGMLVVNAFRLAGLIIAASLLTVGKAFLVLFLLKFNQ